MSALPHLRLLARYKAWADDVIYDAAARLPDGEAEKPRRSVFRNLVHMLNHVYVIDRVFRCHLEGRAHGYTARNTERYPPLPELAQMQREMDRWYVDFADRQAEAALGERVNFEYIGGGAGSMTRGEILLHVVNHATYHRGFVADFFYQGPVRPPATDFTVFLRDARPELP